MDIRILDTLQAYGGRATFFIVGSRVSDYKDTLKRIRDSGSEIGNHTFNHKNLEKISPEEVASQIEMTNDAVEAVTGFGHWCVSPMAPLKARCLVWYPTP